MPGELQCPAGDMRGQIYDYNLDPVIRTTVPILSHTANVYRSVTDSFPNSFYAYQVHSLMGLADQIRSTYLLFIVHVL